MSTRIAIEVSQASGPPECESSVTCAFELADDSKTRLSPEVFERVVHVAAIGCRQALQEESGG